MIETCLLAVYCEALQYLNVAAPVASATVHVPLINTNSTQHSTITHTKNTVKVQIRLYVTIWLYELTMRCNTLDSTMSFWAVFLISSRVSDPDCCSSNLGAVLTASDMERRFSDYKPGGKAPLSLPFLIPAFISLHSSFPSFPWPGW